MLADQIRQIAAWLAATDIGLLELRGPGQALLMRHDGDAVDIVETDGTAPSEAATTPADVNVLTVVAPSVGVFRHRHPMREDSLVELDARVTAGQALGLLQIGPLLIPVRAPADATVHGLLVADGSVVGYGTPLVALRNATAP
jgi:acetyl-CoA carboxylase biotin carboxyl carrier protein